MYSLSKEQIKTLLSKIEGPAIRSLIETMIRNEIDHKYDREFKQVEERSYQTIAEGKAVNDIKRCLDKIKSVKDELLHMHSQINKLLIFEKKLAGALGACYCFGENPVCENCFGKGTPGSFEVDPEAFKKYIYPLIHKLTKTFENNHLNDMEP